MRKWEIEDEDIEERIEKRINRAIAERLKMHILIPEMKKRFNLDFEFDEVRLFEFRFKGKLILCSFRRSWNNRIPKLEWDAIKRRESDILIIFEPENKLVTAVYYRKEKSWPPKVAYELSYTPDDIGGVEHLEEIHSFVPREADDYTEEGKELVESFRNLHNALEICNKKIAENKKEKDAGSAVRSALDITGKKYLKEF